METTLTKAEMAVAVARDMLERLNERTYTKSRYFAGRKPGPAADWRGDLGEFVDEVEDTCKVCLLGSAVLSKAKLYDAVPVAGTVLSGTLLYGGSVYNCIDVDPLVDALVDVFDPQQIAEMEAAFEVGAGAALSRHRARMMPEDLREAVRFGKRASYGLENKQARMAARVKAVAENIIENGGVFVPGKE